MWRNLGLFLYKPEFLHEYASYPLKNEHNLLQDAFQSCATVSMILQHSILQDIPKNIRFSSIYFRAPMGFP